MQVDVQQAKIDLSGLIDKAQAGEEVIISNGNTEVRLVPQTKKEQSANQQRMPGALRGQIWMADDFDRWPDDFPFPFGNTEK